MAGPARTRIRTALTLGALIAATVMAGGVPATAAPGPTLPADTLYVAPDGAGVACSIGHPCGLATAQTQVRALAKWSPGDIDVDLSGGTYHLSHPLQFGPQDSGQHGHTVVYRALPGQNP